MLRRAGIELPEPRQNFKPQVVPCGGVRVRVRVILDMRDVVSARIGDELFSRLLNESVVFNENILPRGSALLAYGAMQWLEDRQ